jgi:hypothetical protein
MDVCLDLSVVLSHVGTGLAMAQAFIQGVPPIKKDSNTWQKIFHIGQDVTIMEV